MRTSSSAMFISLLSLLLLVSTSTSSSVEHGGDNKFEHFLQCLSLSHYSIPIVVHTPNNKTYSAALLSHARNRRFLSANHTKPHAIINPTQESHVQATVVCARKYGMDVKVRSGGHDFEGLSYSSATPFIMIELYDYRNITVNLEENTAWIQAGAQLGEVYYRIAEKSSTHGFPAGFCPTVGVGGHISGGGVGALVRKYGLASDQVIDARVVNVDGKILDKVSMGEDLFWAIRGGGGVSFGIILSWKVKLVEVPPMVTVATVVKTAEQGATNLVHRWQYIADRLHEDLYIGLTITANTTQNGKKTLQVSFDIMLLGSTDRLLQLMEDSFPELGLTRKDCIEMSWVETHVYFYARGRPLNVLLERDPDQKTFAKAKTDYVKQPITKVGLEGLWKRFLDDVQIPVMTWAPYGGRMNEISEYEIPFPHRVGNIYNILYIATWFKENDTDTNIKWMRKVHKYMTPYVSKSPRASYVNYKDLDLGLYKNSVVTYGKAKAWGSKYFLGNFNRLVKVKSVVDPGNFFKNVQSIPPVKSWGKKSQQR